MSVAQKFVVLFVLFWISALVSHVLLSSLLFCVGGLYFKKDISGILFIIVYFLSITCIVLQPPLVEEVKFPLCGEVIQHKDGYVLLKIKHQQVALFMEHTLNYKDEVCVSGTFKAPSLRSNFFYNPIEKWVMTNHHIGSINDVIVYETSSKNSLKGKILNRALSLEKSEHVVDFLFYKNVETTSFFGVLLLSSGLQYTYFLYTLKQLLSKFMHKEITHVILMVFWLFFGGVWGFDFIWWRVFLTTSCCMFVKNRSVYLPLAYFLLLMMFFSKASHVAFVFPMVFQLFFSFQKTNLFQRALVITLLQHVLLYSSNLLMVFFFGLFRHVSGLLYIFSWLVLIFPIFLPTYNRFYLMITTLPQITSFIYVGRFSLVLSLIIATWTVANGFYKKHYRFGGVLLLIIHFLLIRYPLYDMVLFLNVGQADAALVTKAFNKKTMMIDVGRSSNHVLVSQTLKGLGIASLDHIIISHDDDDHSGGLNDLVTLSSNTQVHITKEDVIDGPLYFQALNKSYHGEDDNDNSVIGVVQSGSLTFLFLGDLYQQGERYLIREFPNLQVDVVKLGHHGSKTSTSKQLVANVQPTFAIISAEKRVYNHPHDQTLQTLAQHRVIALDTETFGDIAFVSLFNRDFILTSSGLFGIIK